MTYLDPFWPLANFLPNLAILTNFDLFLSFLLLILTIFVQFLGSRTICPRWGSPCSIGWYGIFKKWVHQSPLRNQELRRGGCHELGHGAHGWRQLQRPLRGPKVRFHTVRKFQDFSVIQILREINLEESRSSKTAVFAISGALIVKANFRFHKVQNFFKIGFHNSQPPDGLKWQILHFYNPQDWFHIKSEW